MATQRVYMAKVKETDGSITKRLVRSGHPGPVMSHVSRDRITVSIPTQNELIECVAAGIKVEDINAQPDQLPLGD